MPDGYVHAQGLVSDPSDDLGCHSQLNQAPSALVARGHLLGCVDCTLMMKLGKGDRRHLFI